MNKEKLQFFPNDDYEMPWEDWITFWKWCMVCYFAFALHLLILLAGGY